MSSYYVFCKYPIPYKYLSCNYFRHDISYFKIPSNIDPEKHIVLYKLPFRFLNKKSILEKIYIPLMSDLLYENNTTNFYTIHLNNFNLANNILIDVFGHNSTSILDSLTVYTPKETNGIEIFNHVNMGYYIGHPKYKNEISYSYITIIDKEKYTEDVFIPIEKLSNKIKRKL